MLRPYHDARTESRIYRKARHAETCGGRAKIGQTPSARAVAMSSAMSSFARLVSHATVF